MDIANVTIDLCQPSPNQYFGDWILNRTFPGKRRFFKERPSPHILGKLDKSRGGRSQSVMLDSDSGIGIESFGHHPHVNTQNFTQNMYNTQNT